MATIRFLPPLSQKATKEAVQVQGATLGELCRKLIKTYRLPEDLFFDATGALSPEVIIFVNRRNARTLQGMETRVDEHTDVLVMQYLVGG